MSIEKAQRLKKLAFAALDRGVQARVSCNDLIDVCLALEEAASGDYENIEFGRALAEAQLTGLRTIINQIANLATPDGEIWKLCYAEYSPEFTVDPDEVLAKIRG